MDCGPPGSSIHGISQARILEWVAISFSRESHSLYYSILDKVIEASAAFGIWEGSWNKSPKDMEGQVY